MLEKGKITDLQLLLLLTVTVLGTAALLLMSLSPEAAGRDAWLVPALSVPVIILVALVTVNLGLRFPNKTIVEYAPVIFGRYFGKAVALVYPLGFIYIGSIILSQFSFFLTTAFMPDTPFLVFSMVLVLLSAWAVRGGIEVIARVGQFAFWIFMASFILIFALLSNQMDFSKLLPVLERGIVPILKPMPVPIAFRSEIFVVLMLLPILNQPWKAYRSAIWSVVLVTAALILGQMAVVSVVGPEIPGRLLFPILTLARTIEVAEFITRLESHEHHLRRDCF